jgi:hypothetical protein
MLSSIKRDEIKSILSDLGFFIPYVYNSLALNEIENAQDETMTNSVLRWLLYAL